MKSNNEVDRLLYMPSEQGRLLISSLKSFYSDFNLEKTNYIKEIYTQDVEFKDPVHTITGSLALKTYLRKMAKSMHHYKIIYKDELVNGTSAYLSWDMEIGHPKLMGGKIFVVPGITHIKFTNKIFYHEDSYDMGSLIYERIPILGRLINYLKNRLQA
jgi:hypothetical protein